MNSFQQVQHPCQTCLSQICDTYWWYLLQLRNYSPGGGQKCARTCPRHSNIPRAGTSTKINKVRLHIYNVGVTQAGVKYLILKLIASHIWKKHLVAEIKKNIQIQTKVK